MVPSWRTVAWSRRWIQPATSRRSVPKKRRRDTRLSGRSGSGQYSIWNTDSRGNETSFVHVSGSSSTLEALETAFQQDLNGDGVIGIAPASTTAPVSMTVIESAGSTSLVQIGNNFYVGTDSSGYGAELAYGGVVQTVDPTGHVAPIGAEKTSTGYQVVWSLGSGQYSIWNTDSRGNETSFVHVSGSSSTLEALETAFQQDLNGDGVIGIALASTTAPVSMTVIESAGSTSLVKIGNNFYVGTDSSGYGAELAYGGVVQTVDPTGHVAPIGAEKTSTGYQVVWTLGSDLYSIWNTDSKGNETSYVHVSGGSSTLKALEVSFHQDLNGDGVIGAASTVLDISGNVKLTLGNMTQSATIETGATLELTGAASGSITFNGATGNLVLDHASQFTGKLINLTGDGTASNSNQIDLKDIAYGAGTSVSYAGTSSGGVLTVADAQNHAANIALVGDYTHSTFNLSSDGTGGTLVIDPPMAAFDFGAVSTHLTAVTVASAVVPVKLIGEGFIFGQAGSPAGANDFETGMMDHSIRNLISQVHSIQSDSGSGLQEIVHFSMPEIGHMDHFHGFLLHQ